MHTGEELTEEECASIREWLDNTSDEPAPKYDGDKVR
jgi:hypothetical protein